MSDKFINKKVTAKKADLSLVTLWREEKAGRFPKRRQLSPGRVGYLESEVDAWIESRANAAGQGAA